MVSESIKIRKKSKCYKYVICLDLMSTDPASLFYWLVAFFNIRLFQNKKKKWEI